LASDLFWFVAEKPTPARNRYRAGADYRAVAELSRSQIAVYGAVAVALLLVGARAIGQDGGGGSGAAFGSPGSGAAHSGGVEISAEGGRDVVVDVAGAVRRPGVYRLPPGARVTDAVERAGGETSRALLDQINLAARLADGQQVVVPERISRSASPLAVIGPGTADGPISLGTATVQQLDTIEGIGPVTAQDIVDFRDQHGGLSSIEQLDQISGIGPATMEALRKRLQP
jgi:competence protein ComEA